jgi:RNA polymerase sigma-70 factor, ECF subfamily
MKHEIAQAASDGGDEAFTGLVHAYRDRVYRVGLRACRDHFDAEDAVQEAFIRLARRPDVQRDRSMLSWLMTVVRNACLRMLRPFLRERARLGVRIEDPEAIAASSLSPEAMVERCQPIERVHAAIAGLPQDFRDVLVLRDLEELTGEETCAALGISEAAMKSRLHRARNMLREALLRRGGFLR